MREYKFTLKQPIMPAVRMTRRGKWTSQRAQAYMASREAIGYELKQQMIANEWEILPGQTPLAVELSIGTDKMHTGDIDNQLKSLLDSANKIVFPDDCWIDSVHVWRYPSSEYQAAFTVWIR